MATGKIQNIALASILADEKWNVRSVGWRDSAGEEEKHDFAQLCESVKLHGIETPIVVRPDPKKAGFFQLVAGFRRLAAATKAELKTIPAHVKDLSDAEARAENIRENTERENLGVPDLVFGVRELDLSTAPKLMTETELGLAIGKSQTYAGKLRKAAKGLTAKVLDAWRKSKVAVKLLDMLDIAELEPAAQEDAFNELVGGKEDEPKGKSGKAGQAEKVVREASKVATILGTAMAREVIESYDIDFGAEFPWDDFLDLKTDLEGDLLESVKKGATDAFKAARNPRKDEPVKEAPAKEAKSGTTAKATAAPAKGAKGAKK